MAQDPSYTYQPTQGAWQQGTQLWCIDASGNIVATTAAGALRVYQATADKLARSTSHTSTTFESGGPWKLVVSGAEAVAEQC